MEKQPVWFVKYYQELELKLLEAKEKKRSFASVCRFIQSYKDILEESVSQKDKITRILETRSQSLNFAKEIQKTREHHEEKINALLAKRESEFIDDPVR